MHNNAALRPLLLFRARAEGLRLHDDLVRGVTGRDAGEGAALVIEAQRNGGANAIYHVLDEGDVKRILAHPMTMVASDGRLSKACTR